MNQISTPQDSGANQTVTTRPTGTFSKILKPFQKSDGATTSDVAQSSAVLPVPSGVKGNPSQLTVNPQSYNRSIPPLSIPVSAGNPKSSGDDKSSIPHELYDRSIAENKILQEKLSAVMKDRDEKIAAYESRNRELEETISTMVSRQDYDLLRNEFDKMIPRHEYDRVRNDLSNSVPLSH